jgi:hypothetical protein
MRQSHSLSTYISRIFNLEVKQKAVFSFLSIGVIQKFMQVKERDGLSMRAHAITWSMITLAISISMLLIAYHPGRCGEYTSLGLTNSRTGGDAFLEQIKDHHHHLARVQVLEQVPVAVLEVWSRRSAEESGGAILTHAQTAQDWVRRTQQQQFMFFHIEVARLSHRRSDTRRRLLEEQEEAPAEEEEDETEGERQEERGEGEDEVAGGEHEDEGLSHVSAISARFADDVTRRFFVPTRASPLEVLPQASPFDLRRRQQQQKATAITKDKAKELAEAAALLEEEEEAEGGDFGRLGVWSRREGNGTEGNGTSTGNESSTGNETNTGGNETTTKEALPQGNVTITLYIGMHYAPADFTDGLKYRFKVAVGRLSAMSPAQIVLNVTAPNAKTKPKRRTTAPLSIVEARIYGGNPAAITQALGSSAALLVKLNKALAEQSISPATGVEIQNDI